jgi:NAD(P)-dependent dehydrogenase (short-subunit alcohol dehydrogenase family)
MQSPSPEDPLVLLVGASSSIGKEIQKIPGYVFIKPSSKQLDISSSTSIDEFVGSLPGKIYGLVISSGVTKPVPLGSTSSSHFNQNMYRIFNINCFGPVLLVNALIKQKKIEDHGSVVFINSIANKTQNPGNSIYGASKSALKRFTDFYAAEITKKKKIRFNTVSPGLLKGTGMINTFITNPEEENNYPLGFGTPQDITGSVALLLSEESKWINGADITIDGGRSLV